MTPTMFLGLFVLLSLNSVFGDTCGGLLEGETGHFSFGNASNHEHAEISSSGCLWVIQLHYETDVRFTLNGLGEDAHLNLYSEDQLTLCSLSDYTKLNSTQVGTSFEFLGKTLVVILPNSSASLAFSWHFAGNEKNGSVATLKNSDYIISPNGLLEWEQLKTEERVTWAINPNANFHMSWDVDVAKNCGSIDKCGCFYFGIFQLTSEGVLSEALRTCGESSEGKLKGIEGSAVVVIKVNTKVEANKVSVSWGLDDTPVTEPSVTEPPVTQPPEPATARLFAATDRGLISLNLETLESAALTSEWARAVAVNNNLSKVYWSQVEGNASILRSNFDGSAKEVIVAPTGGYIEMLAIDEASGNFYFDRSNSHEIIVCNALGTNCTAVVSNLSLVNNPLGIALDSENGFMYWGKRTSGFKASSLVRAHLNGSNAGIISTEFTDLYGITVDKHSNVIYWADRGKRTIGTIDVSGGNMRTLVELPNGSGNWGIQVNNDKIYFSTHWSGTILSVDKYSGRNLTTVLNSTSRVYHLALYNVPINQS